MAIFHRQHVRIAVCILLLIVAFQSQVISNAQQLEKKEITVENAKQIQLIKRVKVTDYGITVQYPTVATRKNVMAFYVSSVENDAFKHNIYLFDLDTDHVINQFEDKEIYTSTISSLKLNDDGTYLAISVNRLGAASVWNIGDASKVYDIQTDPNTDLFTQFDFSSDGTIFAVANEQRNNENKLVPVIEIRDAQTGKLLGNLEGSTATYATVVISNDMQYIAAATGFGPFFEGAAVIDVWDLKTGQLIRTLKGHTGAIIKILFSPDGKQVISASGYEDKSIRIWSLDTGKAVSIIYAERPLQDIALSPDGTLLASTGEDGAIHIWDLANGEALVMLKDETILTPDDAPKSVVFSPDGTRIILCDDTGSMEFWGLQ